MNFTSQIPNGSIIGRLVRLPLRLIPRRAVVPILQGPFWGMKWIVGSSDHGCWLGSYEYIIRETIQKVVRPGQIVYDIGAHVGFYTLLCSVLVGEKGRVVAFEPLPRNLHLLHRHLKLNGISNATVIEAAISNTNDTLLFAEGSSSSAGRLDSDGTIPVRAVTLDSVVTNGSPVPDFIKMDIEGAEMNGLQGAVNLLSYFRPTLILATHSYELQDDCRKFLERFNYAIDQIDGPGADWGPQRDFLCTPNR